MSLEHHPLRKDIASSATAATTVQAPAPAPTAPKHHQRVPSQPATNSASPAFQHSYDKYFSTTNLARVGSAGAPSSSSALPKRGLSSTDLNARSKKPGLGVSQHATPHSSSSTTYFDARQESAPTPESPIDAFAPLLLRTGSRVWEDIQESKGQRWLSSRQSSTNLYPDEQTTHQGENDDDSDEEEEDDYSRARNRYTNRRSSRQHQQQHAQSTGEEYNPLAHLPSADLIDSDPEFLTARSSSAVSMAASKPQFLAGGDDEDDESSEDEDPRFAPPRRRLSHSKLEPSHNKIIAAMDWLLGVGQDDADKVHIFADLYDGRVRKQAAEMAQPQRVEKRDEEQGLNMDVGLVLGYIVSYVL